MNHVGAAQPVRGAAWTPCWSTRACNEPEIQLIARVELEVDLDAVVDTVVAQRDGILERPLALALEHDFVRLAADLRGNQLLEVALRIRIISDWRIFSPIVSDGRHGMLALVP